MKKVLFWILLLVSLLALVLRFSGKAAEILFNIKPRSGISVLSEPTDAKIFINETDVGNSPYENKDLEPKEYLIRVEKDELKWEGRVLLKPHTVTVVNRELNKDQGEGEILTLTKGKGLTIISNPSDSDVKVDGKDFGKTPTSIDVSEGEHIILVSHPNYLNRSIRANLPAKFNMTVSVDLALSEADLTTISTPPIKTTPELKVLDTPTGFLRVRDKPSLSGKEIAKVNPGDTLILLEELTSWDRVRLSDGTEGYVSSAYVEKVTQ